MAASRPDRLLEEPKLLLPPSEPLVEPLPPEHPFRRLDNVIATPHIGYVSRDLYRVFYQDAVANIAGWLGTNAHE